MGVFSEQEIVSSYWWLFISEKVGKIESEKEFSVVLFAYAQEGIGLFMRSSTSEDDCFYGEIRKEIFVPGKIVGFVVK